MKLKQIASITALMAVAVGVCSAQTNGVVGTTTDYSKLNFALTIERQSTNNVVNHTQKHGTNTIVVTTTTWKTTKEKFTNKHLLQIFSYVFGQPSWTNSATKAQLEYDWNSYEVIVADKTGTNILAYLGDSNSNNTNSYLDLDFFYVEGPYTGKDTSNAGQTFNEHNVGELEFYDETFGIDIKGYGPSTEKYTENYNSGKWTDSENFNVGGSWNSGGDIFSGKITAIGRGVYSNE